MSTIKVYKPEREVVSKDESWEKLIMTTLTDSPLGEFGINVVTKGDSMQRQLARAAIGLAKEKKIHLQKVGEGRYLASLQPPIVINQMVYDDYMRYYKVKKYDKTGEEVPHIPPRYIGPRE